MVKYLDRSFTANPLSEYFKWLKCKGICQVKNWGKHLRIGYLSMVSNCTFGKYNLVGSNCILINCSLGDYSYINSYSYVLWATIGKFCSIGPNVKIAPGKHPTSVFVSSHPVIFNNQANFLKNFVNEPKFKNYEPVIIGNDAWIGANSIIMDGVKIGNGAIVAANSIVVKDVADYDIVGGNPAKFIKRRFTESQAEQLLKFEWWNKDDEWIQENIEKFWNIEEFVRYVA